MILNWNRERHRTRDRLLDYDAAIMPPHPVSAGLAMVYPWENTALSILEKQLFTIAIASGYTGTQDDFNTSFGSYLTSSGIVILPYDEFPEIGTSDTLYLDVNTGNLYYWSDAYLEASALPIVNTILYGGGANG